MRTWYASPLKALSNSIYREFCQEFGPDKCGILTGDRKENTGAPIIVGTTEILRNQLYDVMHEGTKIQTDLVILDEAHYLSDPDRGVVWEEVLIYLPPRVRLLLLSATISNGEEVSSWLEGNRGIRASVVRSQERPVPLEMLFLFPDGLISPLAGRKGLVPRVKKFVTAPGGGRRRSGSGKVNFGEIIKCLREFDLLPAIFFLKSRAECDRALISCHPTTQSFGNRDRMKGEIRAFLRQYPHLEGNRQKARLVESRVGSHHAGQLPYWKLLVERLMSKGYLEAMFSTSTVAAGVNFPARTVVLLQSDRYNGREFANLTSTDLHQMSGRAGRRGRDKVGFAMIIPGLHQDPQLIYELRDSPPEPLISQIHINFSMTLNLLLSHRPEEVKDLLDRSFAAFQEKKSGSRIRRQWDEMLDVLKQAIPEGRCDIGDPYEILENIQKRFEMRKEEKRLAKDIQNERLINAYKEYLKPGRLFLHRNKGVYVVFYTYMNHGRLICAAHNIQKTVRMRKQKIRLRRVPVHKIKELYDYRMRLPEGYSPEGLQGLFDAVRTEALDTLTVKVSEGEGGEGELESVRKRLKDLPCEECEHTRECHTMENKALKKILTDFRSLTYQMEGVSGGLWVSFKRHLRFLKETGFVDEMDQMTPDGHWASKLRLDHPLLIAEAIRKGGFNVLSPEVMAGCFAPFVWDRVQEVELKIESPLDLEECERAFNGILDRIEEIRKLKVRREFENPSILFWPAAALFLWAKGVPWEQLLSFIPIDEGDMASLVLRTADHLRQVASLDETHPHLVSAAKTAIELIMHEPVFIE